MATTLADITRKVVAAVMPAPAGEVNLGLPADTCPQCEYSRYGAFAGAAAGDDHIDHSPDRLRREQGEVAQPPRYRCRYCGRVVEATAADAKVSAI